MQRAAALAVQAAGGFGAMATAIRAEAQHDADGPFEPLPLIGNERRLHVRAYDYWRARAAGRAMPMLADCADIESSAFAGRMAIIDLARDDHPARLRSVGAALAAELPRRGAIEQSPLLAELIRRLPAVALQRAPIGFEAELPQETGAGICFRGILLPLADEAGEIAHVLGVMNWRHLSAEAGLDLSAALALAGTAMAPVATAGSPWDKAGQDATRTAPASGHQRLSAARTWAALATSDRARARAHLHAAIGAAHDALADFEVDNARALLPWVFGEREDLAAIEAVLAGARRAGLSGRDLAARLDAADGGIDAFLSLLSGSEGAAPDRIVEASFRLASLAPELMAPARPRGLARTGTPRRRAAG